MHEEKQLEAALNAIRELNLSIKFIEQQKQPSSNKKQEIVSISSGGVGGGVSTSTNDQHSHDDPTNNSHSNEISIILEHLSILIYI